jgi:hypothetical protein
MLEVEAAHVPIPTWNWYDHVACRIFCAMNKWLNQLARCSVSCQFLLSGQSAESSSRTKPARTLTVASCRVTELQLIAQSSRLQNNGQGARRGSMAMNKCV